MTNHQRSEIPCNVSAMLCRKAGAFLRLGMLLTVCCSAVGQSKTNSQFSGGGYADARLAFRYTPPKGMRDKTARFGLQIQDQSGVARPFGTLLAMSSGPDSDVSTWRSIAIVTYSRSAVLEPDDAKAEAQMSAWVAHSDDSSALPKSVAISGQRFSVSVFGLQDGSVKKGAVVWTTVRKGELLSFAFAANSPEQLTKLAESMKSVQFF
jgi:hypothetical protein